MFRTQVGYGDVYPFTALGRAVAAFLAVCAVILLSLSATLLSVNLAAATPSRSTQHLEQREKETKKGKISKYACSFLEYIKIYIYIFYGIIDIYIYIYI